MARREAAGQRRRGRFGRGLDDTPLDETVELEVAADPAAALGPDRACSMTLPSPRPTLPRWRRFRRTLPNASRLRGPGAWRQRRGRRRRRPDGGRVLRHRRLRADVCVRRRRLGQHERARQVRPGPLRAAALHRAACQRPAVLRHLLQRRRVPDGRRRAGAGDAKTQVARTAQWVNDVEARRRHEPAACPALSRCRCGRTRSTFSPTASSTRSRSINCVPQPPSRRFGTRQIPIHTIAFVDRMTEGSCGRSPEIPAGSIGL